MFKKILMCVMLTASFGAPAFAHDTQPSLLSALVNVGNIAKVNANVASQPAYHAPATVADVKANALNGAIKADVDVGQTTRNTSSLLNLNLSVLGGGVGNSHDHY